MAAKRAARKAPDAAEPQKTARRPTPPDPRTPRRILDEEVLLTKPMLAKVLGYKSYRSLDAIVAEDCVSEAPCLKPIYLRRPPAHILARQPKNHPSFKSVRFRREDVLAYIDKMQEDFPLDLEWKFGRLKD